MPSLPAHLYGRGNFGGPNDGSYVVLASHIIGTSETPGAVTTVRRIGIPFDCRLMQIDVSCASSSGGASRPTVAFADAAGNNLLSATNVSAVTADTVSVTPTSATSLVAAERELPKGDEIVLTTTFVATEAVVGLDVYVTLHVKGHAVADKAND